MEPGKPAFTAVSLKSSHGYVACVEELPAVNASGRTLEETREMLQKVASVVFDEERRGTEELLSGKDVVPESFVLPMPKPHRASP